MVHDHRTPSALSAWTETRDHPFGPARPVTVPAPFKEAIVLGDRGMLDALRHVGEMGPNINELTVELRQMRATLEQTIAAMELVADRLLDVQHELKTSIDQAVAVRDDLVARAAELTHPAPDPGTGGR
jgi:hypothetical protein